MRAHTASQASPSSPAPAESLELLGAVCQKASPPFPGALTANFPSFSKSSAGILLRNPCPPSGLGWRSLLCCSSRGRGQREHGEIGGM